MSQLVEEQENNHWKTLSDIYRKYSLHDFKHIMFLPQYDFRNKYETPWTFSSVVSKDLYFHSTFKFLPLQERTSNFQQPMLDVTPTYQAIETLLV